MVSKESGVFILLYITGCLASIPTHSRNKRSQNCYQRLGCFSNAAPYNNTDGLLPQGPDIIRTTFYLINNQSQHSPVVLVDGNRKSITTSGFDTSLQTIFIIHGFMQSSRADWLTPMVKEFLKNRQINIVAVDWGRGSGFPYTQAAANTRMVGAEIASLIEYLVVQTGVSLSSFHLIGHSLGAHAAGNAGKKLTGLGRITGLDPAQPNFSGYDDAVRLDPSDANFVDVIHTDGSPFDEISGFGMSNPVGHMDFYPNGGSLQPGCPHESWMNLVNEEYRDGFDRTEDMISCSHSRSIHLFTDSINRCQFKAYPCPNTNDFMAGRCFTCGHDMCPEMGYNANKRKRRGTFYLATRKNSPFCGKTYLVHVNFGANMDQSYGKLKLRLLGRNGLSEEIVIFGETRGFQASKEKEMMFVSDTSLGDLMQVQLTFTEQNSLFSWGRRSWISISQITVLEADTRTLHRFCRNGRRIYSGQTAGLHISNNGQSCA